MKTKKKKTMIERLREIREKISLDIQDMSFEEMEQYFAERRKEFEEKERRKKFKHNPSLAAEPNVKYNK
jgi:hypothetical protein